MIKNIIFDFGNVIFNIDFTRSFHAFEKLGFSHVREMFTQHTANDLFQKLEKGHINTEDFYEQLKNITAQPVTNEQLQNAWNALLIGFRVKSLDFLRTIKNQYNLYLFK